MSERNIERLRRAIEAFNAHDIEAMIAYYDPSIEFHAAWTEVVSTVYRGHEGLRAWHRELVDSLDAIRLEPEAYFDLGEHTLIFNVLHGRGRHSGAEVAMPLAQVFRSHDGLVVHYKSYLHREDALNDLGVSEDEL